MINSWWCLWLSICLLTLKQEIYTEGTAMQLMKEDYGMLTSSSDNLCLLHDHHHIV